MRLSNCCLASRYPIVKYSHVQLLFQPVLCIPPLPTAGRQLPLPRAPQELLVNPGCFTSAGIASQVDGLLFACSEGAPPLVGGDPGGVSQRNGRKQVGEMVQTGWKILGILDFQPESSKLKTQNYHQTSLKSSKLIPQNH